MKNSEFMILVGSLLVGSLPVQAADQNNLVRQLRSQDEPTRESASREIEKLVQRKQIGQIGANEQTLSDLGAAAVNERNGAIKNRLVVALIATKNPAIVPSLVIIAKSSGDRDVRSVAIRGLSLLGGSEAKSAVSDIYSKDSDVLVRLRAAKALARLGDERGLQEAIQQMNSPSFGVQIEATEALGAFKSKEAHEQLTRVVQKKGGVGAVAEVSLREIDFRSYESESSKLPYLKQALLTPGRSSGWAAQKLFEMRTPAAVQLLLDTAREKAEYGKPEYFAKQNATRAFRSLYHDGTAAGYAKIETMMQTGVVIEQPKNQ